MVEAVRVLDVAQLGGLGLPGQRPRGRGTPGQTGPDAWGESSMSGEVAMGKWRRIIGAGAVCVGVLVPAAAASALPQYVDLGDSYASGVGTRVFYEESGSCKRSPEAYGPKVASARGYALSFQAC